MDNLFATLRSMHSAEAGCPHPLRPSDDSVWFHDASYRVVPALRLCAWRQSPYAGRSFHSVRSDCGRLMFLLQGFLLLDLTWKITRSAVISARQNLRGSAYDKSLSVDVGRRGCGEGWVHSGRGEDVYSLIGRAELSVLGLGHFAVT
eukprot:30007-Hanusia_phi.AAC.4